MVVDVSEVNKDNISLFTHLTGVLIKVSKTLNQPTECMFKADLICAGVFLFLVSTAKRDNFFQFD